MIYFAVLSFISKLISHVRILYSTYQSYYQYILVVNGSQPITAIVMPSLPYYSTDLVRYKNKKVATVKLIGPFTFIT